MNAALALFTYELRAKSRLFIGCAVLAVVPFLATLLPSARGNARDVVAMVGGFLAIIIGLTIAAMMSRAAIVNELVERRMSFWFAKPIRPAALWLGKASAALVTSVLCFTMIAVPAMLFAGPAWKHLWTDGPPVLAAAAFGMVWLFLLGHTVNTVTRSRSLLLALDFCFLLIAAGALVLIARPVLLGGGTAVLKRLVFAIVGGLLVVAAIAPVWQLRHGRADIRRSHAAFSRFFWPCIGVILLLAGGYVAWLVSATPGDLREILEVAQPPRGPKVLVTGNPANRGDYHATFIIDTATGRYDRVSTPPWWGLESSKDGKTFAWLQPSGGFRARQLELYVNGRATGILTSLSSRMVLSDDGTRLATDSGSTVTVYDVATGRIAGSAAGFDPRSQASMYFVTSDLLRIIETTPLRIAELDLRTRRLTRTESPLPAAPRNGLTVSGDGTRMFLRGKNMIVDARSGTILAALEPARYNVASMLHDGSVVAAASANGTAHVHIYGPGGEHRHELTLPETPGLWITGEVEGGKVLLATRRGMLVVDVNRGTIVRRVDGVRGPMPRFSADPRLIRYAADQELVGRTEDGKLVVWKHEGRAEARPLL
ncbi:MAG TPA: hypothetical protein VEO54_07500 [Thermoanaerobaculia bacterium]|nr:hypothetical protein [Thermoanaerobaculia bacterium]